MMRWALDELLEEYERKHKKKLSYRNLAKAVGLNKNTIAAMAQGSKDGVSLGALDTVLNYLSRELRRNLKTQDLLPFEPTKNAASAEDA